MAEAKKINSTFRRHSGIRCCRDFAEIGGISEESRNCVQIVEFCHGQALYYNLLSCTCVKLTQFQSFPIRNEVGTLILLPTAFNT